MLDERRGRTDDRGASGRAPASRHVRRVSFGTEVQCFGNHRVSDYYEWALAVGSETVEECEEAGAPSA
ncbi:hypothetical protein [Actinoplanes ianthinogenes]|uniref:hypothetical protein n=1 Tax=Actinoplanes ianthinogenes TaxID=122358 RepID=UPI001670CC7D|nr:hypothetical protein [Actinoplanes ianthinogenes]